MKGQANRKQDYIAVRFFLILALLPLLPVTVATAQAQQTGAECAVITADEERLACFDTAFAALAASVADARLVLESEQSIPAWPSGRRPATMTIACANDTLSVSFGFAGNLLSALGRDAGITTLSDLQTARSRTLPVNADNTALVIGNSREAAAFLDSLAGARNLTVRVSPANSRSLSVRYRIEDLAEKAAMVRAACGV